LMIDYKRIQDPYHQQMLCRHKIEEKLTINAIAYHAFRPNLKDTPTLALYQKC